MKLAYKILVVATALTALTTSAFAAINVVGTWKGKVQIDSTKVPKAPNPQAQAQLAARLAEAKKIVITLNLKKDKTFTATIEGIKTTDKTDTGTWSIAGNTVTLASKKGDKQNFTVSANGKTMSITQAPFAKVVFTR